MVRSYRGWLIALALVGAAADQASKYVVFHWLQHPSRYDQVSQSGSYEIVPGWFQLHIQYTNKPVQYAETPIKSWLQSWSNKDVLPRVNHGALFGLGNQHEIAANYFFAFVSIAAGFAIFGWSFRPTTSRDRLLCCALGLILGGTLGNLYDRIVFEGVRDFLYFYRINWPVFNVADCCLVCGAFLLLAQAFLTNPATHSVTTSGPETLVLPTPEVANVH